MEQMHLCLDCSKRGYAFTVSAGCRCVFGMFPTGCGIITSLTEQSLSVLDLDVHFDKRIFLGVSEGQLDKEIDVTVFKMRINSNKRYKYLGMSSLHVINA